MCAATGATPNTANCNWAVADLTGVGSYTGSASPEGTFDQGGNVWEWNEAISFGSNRGWRGASFSSAADVLSASSQGNLGPTGGRNSLGFRVAMIPEPSTALLLATSLAALAATGRRRLPPS